MKSQNERILARLKKKLPVTAWQALQDYGCFRLAARICDLRDQGYIIDTEIVNDTGKRYARYWWSDKND